MRFVPTLLATTGRPWLSRPFSIRAARVVVAIERYRREHRETMPARLDDLVPVYLAAVPVDPYSGWQLLFRAEARSYVVYSLGPNQRDDSGDFTLLRFVQAARE